MQNLLARSRPAVASFSPYDHQQSFCEKILITFISFSLSSFLLKKYIFSKINVFKNRTFFFAGFYFSVRTFAKFFYDHKRRNGPRQWLDIKAKKKFQNFVFVRKVCFAYDNNLFTLTYKILLLVEQIKLEVWQTWVYTNVFIRFLHLDLIL